MMEINKLYMLWIVLMTFIYLNLSSSNKEFVLNTLSEQCPYLSTCTRPAQQEFTLPTSKFTPCCRECSCSRLCHVEGSCCPDINHNSTDIPGNLLQEAVVLAREKCIESAFPGSPTANGYNSIMFKTITTCLKDYPNNDIAEKCTAEVPKTIDQVTLVSDDHGTIYRNIYCAQCNGAENVRRWTITIRCKLLKHPEVSFQIELSYLLDRNCQLISLPQTSLANFTNKRCFVRMISECNVTGYWKVYDEKTERACQTVNSVFLPKILFSVYKNIFCYKCNGNPIHGNINCPVHSNKRVGMIHPFTAVLDFNILSPDFDRLSKRCSRHEIYDPFFVSI